MTLGIIGKWTEKGFSKVASYGLPLIEFCYNPKNDPGELLKMTPELIKYSEKYNVKVGAIGRWGADKFTKEGVVIDKELEACYKLIDVAAALSCPVFNTGVNFVKAFSFEANCDLAVGYLEKIIEYGRKTGVKIAVYNCDWSNFIKDPASWEAVLGRLPDLGIKYDPSHCINKGSGDYMGEISEWGHKICHFHVKGTLNVKGLHLDDPPAGLDMISWPTVLGLLYKADYKGMLSIEPHSPTIWRGRLGEWGIKYTIKYISPMLDGRAVSE